MKERFTVTPKPLVETEQEPAVTKIVDEDTLFVDFGKAAFGTITVSVTTEFDGPLVVHLGEMVTDDGRVEREPPGSIFYIRIEQPTRPGETRCRVIIPPNERNTGPGAILMPDYIGEVCPFRYVEIEGVSNRDTVRVRRICVNYPFDDNASSFESSNDVLNAVWDLSKYSIKATTFCGVYVDGNRERIPYEADAYINQLGHYCVDSEYDMARYTSEYLIQYPTWPTEWQLFCVLVAWEDYLYSGDPASLEMFYDDLCVKTLIDLADDDGLISTETGLCTREFEERLHLYHSRYIFNHGLQDIVDWPPGSFTEGGQGERDGHEMRPVNTVVNAFFYRALVCMSNIADALGRHEDEDRFADRAKSVKSSFNACFYDTLIGRYIDGEGSTHASLHSNMFALAFGLVPEGLQPRVVEFVISRGMACSVYASQFLLEALYVSGAEQAALELLCATHDRSWWNMIRVGSTVTLEAWDWKYKNNLDWNHAWGAAPANIIPRYLMGVRPLEPGFKTFLIEPKTGTLEKASLKHPTPLGPIHVRFERGSRDHLLLEVEVPQGAVAVVHAPVPTDPPIDGKADSPETLRSILFDRTSCERPVTSGHICFDGVRPGKHVFELPL